MESRSTTPYFVIIGLLVLTSLALGLTIDVNVSNQAGVQVNLPEVVHNWNSREVRYCTSKIGCRPILTTPLDEEPPCPHCESPTDAMSLAEKRLLPADTLALKRQYEIEPGHLIYASLVMSGSERGSIHRPEVCLRGQGRKLVGRYTLSVPIQGQGNLKVRVLDLLDETRYPDGRKGPELESYYAYWFVGKDRETASHFERIFWMGYDRIFRNVSHRWAYLAIGGGRQQGSDQYQDEIREFIQHFYPQMKQPVKG